MIMERPEFNFTPTEGYESLIISEDGMKIDIEVRHSSIMYLIAQLPTESRLQIIESLRSMKW